MPCGRRCIEVSGRAEFLGRCLLTGRRTSDFRPCECLIEHEKHDATTSYDRLARSQPMCHYNFRWLSVRTRKPILHSPQSSSTSPLPGTVPTFQWN